MHKIGSRLLHNKMYKHISFSDIEYLVVSLLTIYADSLVSIETTHQIDRTTQGWLIKVSKLHKYRYLMSQLFNIALFRSVSSEGISLPLSKLISVKSKRDFYFHRKHKVRRRNETKKPLK